MHFQSTFVHVHSEGQELETPSNMKLKKHNCMLGQHVASVIMVCTSTCRCMYNELHMYMYVTTKTAVPTKYFSKPKMSEFTVGL